MTPANIREHLLRKPFHPFRIRVSDGQHFDIAHPDLCMVGPHTIYVGIPHPKQKGLVMHVVHCSLLHVTTIEPLNGHRPKASNRSKR